MASHPNPSYYAASGADMSRDVSWQSRSGTDMDRTVGSNSTTLTSYSAHSSATAFSTHDLIFPKVEADQASSSYPELPAVYEDINHFLSATGDQFSQEPCTPSPLEPFTTQAGREDAAWQATHAARLMITEPQFFWNANPLFITSEAVEGAIRGYRVLGIDDPARPSVQHVLLQHLYPRFSDLEHFSYPEINQILKEAAYQLQVRLEGPEAIGICYVAIAAVLAELMGPEQAAGEASGQELINLDGADSLFDP